VNREMLAQEMRCGKVIRRSFLEREGMNVRSPFHSSANHPASAQSMRLSSRPETRTPHAARSGGIVATSIPFTQPRTTLCVSYVWETKRLRENGHDGNQEAGRKCPPFADGAKDGAWVQLSREDVRLGVALSGRIQNQWATRHSVLNGFYLY
jgi:hypothetical protein